MRGLLLFAIPASIAFDLLLVAMFGWKATVIIHSLCVIALIAGAAFIDLHRAPLDLKNREPAE